MGAGAFTIFRKNYSAAYPLGTAVRYCFMYGACNGRVRCGIRFIGTFKGTDQHPAAHVEILFNEFQYVPAFAVSSILVILAIILLVMRSVLEHKGKTTKKPL